MPNEENDWQPTARIEILKARAQILRDVRRFFDDRGFFEVQTPCLSSETVIDAHLDPIAVPRGGAGKPLYLQTSAEAAMKRLVAGGAEAIYQLGPVFRADESGSLHNPEFTMLEWYRRNDTMQQGMALLDELAATITGRGPARRVTYRELFLEMLDLDPIGGPISDLRSAIDRADTGYAPTEADQRDDLLDVLMSLAIQPRLSGVSIVSNYPLSQAALARLSDTDPQTAERFEMFIDGVEIANGYAELLDPQVLRDRSEVQNGIRIAKGQAPLPLPRRLIAAMQQGLPSCSGTAVGIDRLVMAATGETMIHSVIPFPLDRA